MLPGEPMKKPKPNKGKREPRPTTMAPKLAALPTYEEAMIRRAEELVERVEDKLTGSARQWIKAALLTRLRGELTDRQKVIDAARDGDDLSHDVLMAEFHGMLDEGIMPPASLRDYAARTEEHPRRGRGRVWYDDWGRNWGFLAVIVLIGMEFNLNPTRNRASEGPSATSIVAIALQRRGFKRVSESRLTNLWGQLGETAIQCFALYRVWPELAPYVGMSGNLAKFDLRAALGPYLK